MKMTVLIIAAAIVLVFVIYVLHMRDNTHQVESGNSMDTTAVVSVYIKNSEGKLLVLRYGAAHPSLQWTTLSSVVKINKNDPASIENARTAFVISLAKEQSGLDVSNLRQLADEEVSGIEHISILADSEGPVHLKTDSPFGYSEYVWVSREELALKTPSDIHLTQAELDTIFAP